MEPGSTFAGRRVPRPIMVVGGGAFGLDTNGGPLEVVADRAGPAAYRVEPTADGVAEARLSVRMLVPTVP